MAGDAVVIIIILIINRNVDGIVEMMLDATQKYDQLLTEDRLFGWHAILFPTGRSGLDKIQVGSWRDDANGPMQVVSGAIITKLLRQHALMLKCCKIIQQLTGKNSRLRPLVVSRGKSIPRGSNIKKS